ncbi:MAG: HTTM domain-containing protein, partial [Candidatus Obscuribacterales bacterium]|nr:HTTM domain-containing protein [Candidatus Obscuribacterales bacterium]
LPRFDLFLIAGQDWTSQAYFYSLIVAAACLTIGLGTRFSAGYLAMGFISLFNHNPFIFNSGEALLRLNAIFLTFSPAGNRYSLDCWLREKRGLPGFSSYSCPWAQRMIQLQLTIAYAGTFCTKIRGPQWWNGDAVYYATRLTEFINLPLPLLNQIWFCHACTWLTLVIELAGFTLIWFKPLRPYIIVALLIFHLGIAYLFFLPIFEFLFITSLVTFIEPDIVKSVVETATGLWRQVFNQRRTIDTTAPLP